MIQYRSTGNIVKGFPLLQISNSNCFYTLHVLCNGIGHLRSTFVFGTWTNESYNITFLDIRISKIFDAIDIYITREILDVDIAILGISNLGHYTTNAVLCSTNLGGNEFSNSSFNDGALL